jgi:hypothetical protein
MLQIMERYLLKRIYFKIICLFFAESIKSIKNLFFKSVKVHEKFSHKEWQLDRTTIFAQIDAFIQRCKDLIEVNL